MLNIVQLKSTKHNIFQNENFDSTKNLKYQFISYKNYMHFLILSQEGIGQNYCNLLKS